MRTRTWIVTALALLLALPMAAGPALGAKKVVEERSLVEVDVTSTLEVCGVSGEMSITGQQRFDHVAWDNGHITNKFWFHARVLDASGALVATVAWHQFMDNAPDAWPLTATTVEVVRCANGSDEATACSAHLTYNEQGVPSADSYSCG